MMQTTFLLITISQTTILFSINNYFLHSLSIKAGSFGFIGKQLRQNVQYLIWMKYFLYFLANIAISFAIFYATYNSQKDYIQAVSTAQCFQEEAKTVFCAQCIERSKQINLSPQKGFLVYSKDAYSLLKQQNILKARTCNQYLHIINYAKSDKGSKLPLQLLNEFKQQFEGKISINMEGSEVISPKYEQFVIYRLFPLNQSKKTSVKYADLSRNKAIIHKLAFLVNAIVALLAVLCLVKRSVFTRLQPKVIILTIVHYITLQAYAYEMLPSELAIKLTRILVLCIILALLQINNKIITLALFIGCACTFYSLSYLIYLNLMSALIFTKGMNEQKYKNMWTYIILNVMIYLLNQFFWYFLLQEIADTPCRFIEIMFLILTPTGLLLIKDEKQVKFEVYKQNRRHTISLRGFQEQQDQEQNM